MEWAVLGLKTLMYRIFQLFFSSKFAENDISCKHKSADYRASDVLSNSIDLVVVKTHNLYRT